jgi:hypothetical protein
MRQCRRTSDPETSKEWGRQRHRFALAGVVALFACSVLAWPPVGSAAGPKTITIAAASPEVDNCWPFGTVQGGGDWRPNFAFVYANIPAFALKPGDNLAFDNGGEANDFDVQVDVALAPTTVNGGDVNAGPFTTVVNNTQTPANPRSNMIQGDFELSFVAEAPFSFPGGGLIIRISNPSPAYTMDTTCTGAVVGGLTGDPSGLIVERTFKDADGVSPWDDFDNGPVSDFRLTLLPTSNLFSFGKLIRNRRKGTARLPVTVPGPGTLALGGKGLRGQPVGGKAVASTDVAGPGTVNLTIKPKGKLKKRVSSRHKAKVGVTVTFTPSGDPAGDPKSQGKKISLVKKSRRT